MLYWRQVENDLSLLSGIVHVGVQLCFNQPEIISICLFSCFFFVFVRIANIRGIFILLCRCRNQMMWYSFNVINRGTWRCILNKFLFFLYRENIGLGSFIDTMKNKQSPKVNIYI